MNGRGEGGLGQVLTLEVLWEFTLEVTLKITLNVTLKFTFEVQPQDDYL